MFVDSGVMYAHEMRDLPQAHRLTFDAEIEPNDKVLARRQLAQRRVKVIVRAQLKGFFNLSKELLLRRGDSKAIYSGVELLIPEPVLCASHSTMTQG